MKKYLRDILLACMVGILIFSILGCKNSDSVPVASNLDSHISIQNNIDKTTNTTLPTNKKNNSWGDLRLNPSESAYIYMNGESNTIQSHRVRAASMIKVYILSYLFEKIDKGEISLQDVYVLKPSDKVGGSGVLYGYESGSVLSIDTIARLMITESDNTATNILIDKLGLENINSYIVTQGYKDTQLNRKMMDVNAIDKGIENYTSAQDLGNWFLKLASGKMASALSNKQMIDYLVGQTDTECISAALPNRIIAHKTGELAGVYHDGGIIYNTNRNDYYILILLSDGYDSRDGTIESFRSIARQVDIKVNWK